MTTQPDLRPRLLVERFVEGMSPAEYERALRVTRALPAIAERAAVADHNWAYPTANLSTLRAEGVLGLMVPTGCGGLGGDLRDLAAATFAIATACPSTALTFFFHSSAVSRGTLALEAADAEDHKRVFKHTLKHVKWLANKRELQRVVLHSFTHLGGENAAPEYALDFMAQLEARLASTGYTVRLTPFGYFCSWDLRVYGDSLAKVYKAI